MYTVIGFSIALPDTANDWQGDDKSARIFRAPSATLGGGITILAAYVTEEGVTTSGTAHSWQLLNYGTPGTANLGTVSAVVGGTADVFVAGLPKAFTLSDPVLDADEWLVLNKQEDNSSDPVRGVFHMHYIMGTLEAS